MSINAAGSYAEFREAERPLSKRFGLQFRLQELKIGATKFLKIALEVQ